MSVLIKGMEMPDMCSECDFCGGLIFPDNIYCCDCPSDAIYGKNITRAIEEDCRHPDCPHVPIPPHGRLGDLDALIEKVIAKYLEHERKGELVFAAAEIKQDIVDLIIAAPTIIPAEEAPAEDINVPTTYDLLYEEGGPDTR